MRSWKDKLKALWAFEAIYSVSLASELMGTTYGIPFGAYSYTALLGVKWFDRVPLLIPLSWFTMSWACWVIARRSCQRMGGNTAWHVFVGRMGFVARSGDEQGN